MAAICCATGDESLPVTIRTTPKQSTSPARNAALITRMRVLRAGIPDPACERLQQPAGSGMTARSTRILVISAAFLAGLVLCFGVVLIVTGRLSSPVAQQIAAIGGPFKLTDHNRQTVTDQDLKGHPFLVFFGFTHCPDVCPPTLFKVSQILPPLHTAKTP